MKGRNAKMKKQEESRETARFSCADKQCPIHGSLKTRGRIFQGRVIKKFPRRACIEFERTIYIRKFERYMKKRSRIHARLPDCLKQEIEIGDYIEVRECRPLSKIIHFVVIRKIKGGEKEIKTKIQEIKEIK